MSSSRVFLVLVSMGDKRLVDSREGPARFPAASWEIVFSPQLHHQTFTLESNGSCRPCFDHWNSSSDLASRCVASLSPPRI
ncbi:MAG UNVERIFIED_CONTAM: hypothetical protein LVR18_15930 [Planctomycetaceae bacterium]